MVRLKDNGTHINRIIGLGFNSTMVRLKGITGEANGVYRYTFQFHNGSIKSTQDSVEQGVEQRFQFHNGSIKSPKKPMEIL